MRERRPVKAAPDATRVVLAPSADIASAAALRAELDAALAAGRPIELDAGDTGRIDGAALQLLAAFALAARHRKLALRWSRVHPNVAAGAALLGLTEAIGLDGRVAA
jgi:anti-anti-sigma regulatory factor